jgi:hypothetical protein
MQKDTLLYQDIWKKSFLIEILYNGDAESFIFSLPPEGIEINITQRTTETNTFGGVFIDEYGIGIGKIHLSGSTGNSNIKIVQVKRNESWMTGKDEIYHIRDKIARYKESERWKQQEIPPRMNLYNLASSYNEAGGWENKNFHIDAWEVALKDFKISQTSGKPFVYNYSIDFTAIRLLGESKINGRPAPCITKPPDLKWYEKVLKGIETWYGWSETVKNAVQDFRNSVNRYAGEVERYLALITGSIDNYMSALENGVYTVTDVYNTFKRVTMAPADTALRMVAAAKRIRESVEAMVKDIQSLPDQWSEKCGSVGKSIESEIKAYESYFEDNMQELENATNQVYAETVSGANPEVTIIPGGDTENGPPDGGSDENDETPGGASGGVVETVIAYGYMRHIATSETTLEKLAEVYLGDPDKAQVLAIMNGITGDDEINPGDQIKIPILSENSINALNHIFGSVNNRDTLGIDIAIANGILQVGPNGDFVEQVDYKNMNQAIGMRLSESIGNRIRLNTYGIRNVSGMPDSVASAYIATSIKDTVMQDPRVQQVDNLYFRGNGDAVFVSFDYYTYDGVLRRYEGGL